MWRLRCWANLRQLWTAEKWDDIVERKNYTCLNHTRVPSPSCCSPVRGCKHVDALCCCVRPCMLIFVCVCVFSVCGWGVVRQYSHQAEQSGSINWWNSKPPASITIITNSSTQNVWLFLDKDSVLSAAILLMPPPFRHLPMIAIRWIQKGKIIPHLHFPPLFSTLFLSSLICAVQACCTQ